MVEGSLCYHCRSPAFLGDSYLMSLTTDWVSKSRFKAIDSFPSLQLPGSAPGHRKLKYNLSIPISARTMLSGGIVRIPVIESAPKTSTALSDFQKPGVKLGKEHHAVLFDNTYRDCLMAWSTRRRLNFDPARRQNALSWPGEGDDDFVTIVPYTPPLRPISLVAGFEAELLDDQSGAVGGFSDPTQARLFHLVYWITSAWFCSNGFSNLFFKAVSASFVGDSCGLALISAGSPTILDLQNRDKSTLSSSHFTTLHPVFLTQSGPSSMPHRSSIIFQTVSQSTSNAPRLRFIFNPSGCLDTGDIVSDIRAYYKLLNARLEWA
ncbi:hypothetical protein GALMADRAFT_213528 [Galerina marginata CBS 339.88]|uniref:Uncharacterized protein n=1 Tax=Galerina marginata (strain CBS 339.88) TaxID=685588 RepID=A0A067SMF4_GALM3|nr:hypothetical protein GALMADRAFT_213528 [Galerina marginata CBS 339.88]